MKNTVEEIGDAWIAYAQYPSPAEDAPDQVTADSYDLGYLVDDEPERAWEVIRYIVSRYSEADLVVPEETEANKVVGLLAAGPLEDILSFHGPNFIERVEAEAEARSPHGVGARRSLAIYNDRRRLESSAGRGNQMGEVTCSMSAFHPKQTIAPLSS